VGVGPMIEQQLAIGDPADLILTASDAHDADLIVMVSLRKPTASRFLVGLTSTNSPHIAHIHVASSRLGPHLRVISQTRLVVVGWRGSVPATPGNVV
jgi:hypothetical protein